MIKIHKSTPPVELTEYQKQVGAYFDGLPSKQPLRVSLTTEQHGLCCYCMGRIKPERGNMKIEHFLCKEDNPSLELIYSNLMGACMGGEGKPEEYQHCDTKKRKAVLSANPSDPTHDISRSIRYLRDGTIESDDAVLNNQIDDILNLNLDWLKQNRRGALDGFQAFIEKMGTLSKAEWVTVFENWKNKNPDYPPYLGIVQHYIRKKTKGAI